MFVVKLLLLLTLLNVGQAQYGDELSTYAHPAVIANAERDSHLPVELLKSERFYSNPKIAAALAQESWFANKEMPVVERAAEKIPREQIFKLFKNAGFIRRRR